MENQDRPRPVNPEEVDSPSTQQGMAQPDGNGAEPEDGADGADDDGAQLNGPDSSAANLPNAGMTQPGAQLGGPMGRRRRRRRRRGRGAPVYFTSDGQAYRMQTTPDGQQVQVFLTAQELQQYQARVAQQNAVPGQRPLGPVPTPPGQQPAATAQLAPAEGVLDTEAKGPNAFLRQIRRHLL